MGFVFSKAMNDSLKGQQEFMRLQLERQLILQNLMRERQTAMQIAWTREFLKYFGTFCGLAAVVLTTGAIKRKNPAVLLPMLPLSFVFSYHYDMGYGTLLQRMKVLFFGEKVRDYKIKEHRKESWPYLHDQTQSSGDDLTAACC